MPHPNRSKIKDWPAYLREFRAKHGLSQKGLADKLMVTLRRVEDWEQGIYKPDNFLKLAMQQIEASAGVKGGGDAWQPIETAPKDGTYILAWMVDQADIRKGFPKAELNGMDIVYWSTINKGGWVGHRFGTPVLWQPVQPPATATQRDEGECNGR